MYPEQHSPLSWSRRPARPWQPYSLGFFPGLQLPYRQLSNVTPDRPLRPGSLTNSSWMRNCTVLGDAVWKGFPAFPAHLRRRPVSRGNSRRATWVGPHAERPRFRTPLLRRTQGPDPSSKATLWVKAQHEGALPAPCIVCKDPRVPHTAR